MKRKFNFLEGTRWKELVKIGNLKKSKLFGLMHQDRKFDFWKKLKINNK